VSKTKTVAIIGGGLSGLSAGGLLSRKGFRVKLFEASDKIGGCCANTNIAGYHFNDGALYLVLPCILDYIFEKLGLERLLLLPLHKIAKNETTTLPDGTTVSIADGLDISIKKNKGAVDRIKLRKEINRMLKKWEPVLRLFADEIIIHPYSLSRLIVKGWHHLHKFRGTVASELNKLFSDEAVRAAMAGVLLYTGLPPQKIPVTQVLGLIAMLSDGFYVPEGGMGKIPEALSQSLKNNGGEIFLNSTIDKIILRNGHVYGLKVDGQDIIEVDAIISTVSGMMTFDSLLNPEDISDEMKRKVQNAQLSHKALCLQLGLSNKVDVHSYSNSVLPIMEEQYKVFTQNEDEVKWFNYTVPTVIMPELAPQGCSIIEMFPPIKQEVPVDDWNEQRKERIVESAVKALSRIHKLDIVVKRVLSPKDYRDKMHFYKGAIYGLSPAVDPGALFPHKSPISGLYQAGQTTYPGYGVAPAAMSGIFAAERLMKIEIV
jgi:phytoene desaturase